MIKTITTLFLPLFLYLSYGGINKSGNLQNNALNTENDTLQIIVVGSGGIIYQKHGETRICPQPGDAICQTVKIVDGQNYNITTEGN